MGDSQFTRGEILHLVIRLSVFSLATYLSIKFLINQLDPTVKQKKKAKRKAEEQLRNLGIGSNNEIVNQLTEYELMIASHLVNPADINVTWEDIAGLKETIQELRETVILPIQRKDLIRESRLTQPPKGVLLHGPPGCGKTLIAKATAQEAGTRFINLDLSILTDKWYGESQKLTAAVFSVAVKLQPCIIFIDEIDSFLRIRNSHDHEATAMMKAQFMSLWDGLITDSDCTVIIMGATNRPQDLDRAILRRMPATFHIGMPTVEQRHQILKLILKNEPVNKSVDVTVLAKESEGFSGSDLKELCRNASVYRMRDFMHRESEKECFVDARCSTSASETDDEGIEDNSLRFITMDDLMKSLHKMKQSKLQCSGLIMPKLDID